jgi:hypothetical protein
MGIFVPHWSVMQCMKIGSVTIDSADVPTAKSLMPCMTYQFKTAQHKTGTLHNTRLLSFGGYVDPKGHISIKNTKYSVAYLRHARTVTSKLSLCRAEQSRVPHRLASFVARQQL